MLNIRDIALLQPGDVLHNPNAGFALVDQVSVDGATVLADTETDRAATNLSAAALSADWRLCTPWGLLFRAVRDPEGLRTEAERDPVRVLQLILDDLQTPQTADAIEGWVVGRRLVGRGSFKAWWSNALAQLSRGSEVVWDGRHLASRGLDPSMPGDPATFLALPPSGRFEAWRVASPKGRNALLEAAVESGDGFAVQLCLRGREAVPHEFGAALQARALGGDPWLCGALLDRQHGACVTECAKVSADPSRRGLVSQALGYLPPTRRTAANLTLLDRVLNDHDEGALNGGSKTSEDGVAARFLAELLPLGIRGTANALAADSASGGPQWPHAAAWLTAQTQDKRDVQFLASIKQLDPTRLFTVSLALARALAERHADDACGGVSGAQLLRGDRVKLGPPSKGDPRRDVLAAARVLVERGVGQLPRNGRVRADDLVIHLAQLIPDAPIEWAAVMARALSPEPGLRPSNGLDLWEQLALAEAVSNVRLNAPHRRKAGIQAAHDTHIGVQKSQVGQTNQDAVYWQVDDNLALLAVADGISVSTAGSGDKASAILVRTLAARWEAAKAELLTADSDSLDAFLVDALATASHAVCARSLELAGGSLGRQIPMGTTAILAIVRGDDVHLAALGDSRAYLVGAAGATQLTGDQNLRGAWLKGWQDGEQPSLINEGYALLGYCGHFNELGRSDPAPPDLRRVRLLPGESLILCSDGVTDYAVGSPAEAAILMEDASRMPDLAAASRWLVDRSNDGGGGDNITVIVARQDKG